jgi:hypothetical protein
MGTIPTGKVFPEIPTAPFDANRRFEVEHRDTLLLCVLTHPLIVSEK